MPYIFVVAAFALHLVVLSRVVYRALQLRRFARAHGCQPVTSKFSHNPWYLGFDYLLHQARQLRAHTLVRSFTQLFDQFGPTFATVVVAQPVFHTIDPVNLKALLSTNNSDYTIIPARRTLVNTVFGAGVFGTEGRAWMHSRAVVRQSFNLFTFDQQVYKEHADRLIASICADRYHTIDFSSASSQFIIDSVLDLYFGDRPSLAGSRDLASGFIYLADMGRRLTLFGRRMHYAAHLLVGRKFRVTKKCVEDQVDQRLREARLSNAAVGEKHAAEKGRTTLAQAMMSTTDDIHTARAEMLSLMLAGNDSIAFLLAEIVWLLARHPDVWTCLRSEVLHHSIENAALDPNADAIKKMPYLQSVLNESLRLRPTLSVHGRYSIRDTVLPHGGGKDGTAPILIPAHSYVVYSGYALGQNQSLYGTDVEAFRPERWQGGLKPTPIERMSFGAGARTCLGERLAREIAGYTLFRLAQAFERIEPRDDRPWEEATAFTFFNRNGTAVAFGRVEFGLCEACVLAWSVVRVIYTLCCG